MNMSPLYIPPHFQTFISSLVLPLLPTPPHATPRNQTQAAQAFADLREDDAMAACGEMNMNRVSISVSDSVVCPKPRRIGLLNPAVNDQIRPSRLHLNRQTEISDSKAGMELLDIILAKGNHNTGRSNNHVASSPPYFCGSPPSRAANPLIQDSQFANKEFSPLSQQAPPVQPPSPSSSARKGGSCARVKFGHKPAAVRIEGFDCLSRDRRSISAVA